MEIAQCKTAAKALLFVAICKNVCVRVQSGGLSLAFSQFKEVGGDFCQPSTQCGNVEQAGDCLLQGRG